MLWNGAVARFPQPLQAPIVKLFSHKKTNIEMDKQDVIYKDLRFWLVVLSLLLLFGMVIRSYPAE